MREILFQGKRVDNGQWVEGSLLGSDVIVPKGQRLSILALDMSIIDRVTAYPVIPETVRQYTGLPDKSGTKIFGGDILRDDDNEENGVVEFDEGEYYVVFGNVCTHGIADIARSCYIIGNIYDNPELLEVQE